jgi:hypothetical protein
MTPNDVLYPFEEFVLNKNKTLKGFIYDYFGREWSYQCPSCALDMFAPSKKSIKKTTTYHYKEVCGGGW